MEELNKKQKEIINELNKVLSKCRKEGIKLFGMDDDINYISVEAIKDAQNRFKDIGKTYNYAADAYRELQYEADKRIGTLKTSHVYVDSGGW